MKTGRMGEDKIDGNFCTLYFGMKKELSGLVIKAVRLASEKRLAYNNGELLY